MSVAAGVCMPCTWVMMILAACWLFCMPLVTADAAALAVESLINSGSIGGGSGVTGYVDAASRSSLAAQQAGALLGLRALAEQQEGQQEQLLMPHEALMW